MAKRRMTYELDADESKAMDAFRALDAEQRKMLIRGESINKSTQKQGEVTNWAAGQWKALVGAAMGMVGVNQVISKAIELIREYDQHLKSINEKQVKSAGGAIPLAALQKPEDVSRVLREAAAISAGMGVSPEVGFTYFQRGQSVRGTWEGGRESAIAAMQLGLLTQDHETAAETIKIARELGMSQKEFNAVLAGAASSSAANEAVFAQTASFWPMFTGAGGEPEKYFGAAITNVLSQRIDSSKLPTYVQAVTRTLTDVEGPLQKAVTESMDASGRTFRDLNNLERLAEMRAIVQEQYGEVTPETLRLAGISEMRERTALATLFTPQNMQGLVRVLGEAPGYAAEWDIGERLADIQTDPAIRQKYLQDRSAATAEAFALMGPEAEAARERMARRRAVGAEVGYGMGVNLETGEAGYRTRVLSGEYARETARTGQFGPYYDVRQEGGPEMQDRLENALQENARVLREIADNTRADKKPERVVMRGEVE